MFQKRVADFSLIYLTTGYNFGIDIFHRTESTYSKFERPGIEQEILSYANISCYLTFYL